MVISSVVPDGSVTFASWARPVAAARTGSHRDAVDATAPAAPSRARSERRVIPRESVNSRGRGDAGHRRAHQVDEVVAVEGLADGVAGVAEAGFESLDRSPAALDVGEVRREERHL